MPQDPSPDPSTPPPDRDGHGSNGTDPAGMGTQANPNEVSIETRTLHSDQSTPTPVRSDENSDQDEGETERDDRSSGSTDGSSDASDTTIDLDTETVDPEAAARRAFAAESDASLFDDEMTTDEEASSGLFDELLSGAQIFEEKEVLRPSYTPDTLPHRESQINAMATILVSALRGDTPSNILVYGKTGTGKTASAKFVSQELESTSQAYDLPCDVEYINCEVTDTQYRVLAQLANNFIADNKARAEAELAEIEEVLPNRSDNVHQEDHGRDTDEPNNGAVTDTSLETVDNDDFEDPTPHESRISNASNRNTDGANRNTSSSFTSQTDEAATDEGVTADGHPIETGPFQDVDSPSVEALRDRMATLDAYLETKAAVPMTGWPTDQVYSEFFDSVDFYERVVVIMLDEIDKLVEKSGDDTLYNLSRMNTDLENSRVSIIGISNDLKFTDFLDPRVKSSLGEEEIVFPPYDAAQIQDILEQRAEIAFKDGVLDDGVIPLCAAFAAQEHGDARRALDLFRTAGELVERSDEDIVKEQYVRKAQEKIELDRIVEAVRTLPTQSKLILLAIIKLHQNGETDVNTGEVFNVYKQLCTRVEMDQLTQRRVTDLISELDMLGIVNAVVVSKGRYGRSKEISLSVPAEETRQVLTSDSRLKAERLEP